MSAKVLKQIAQVKTAARSLRKATSRKNDVLITLSKLIRASEEKILAANIKDLKLVKSATPAFRDRLTLNNSRLEQICHSLEQVAALPDPVGELSEIDLRPNGLKMRKTRSPLGVIFMIFESRPNVAVESFSIAFKSGNCAILRGGKESAQTVRVFYDLISQALEENGFSRNCVLGITDPNRNLVKKLLKQKHLIDVVVPRGGDQLIEFVVNESLIPIIKNDRGLCHVYLHSDSDPAMARRIVENAKTQRPGVCNSMETLLVNEIVAHELLPLIYDDLSKHNVIWYCCPKSQKILGKKSNVKKASEKSFNTEYLDLKINCKVVKDLSEALEHIEIFGSRHSEAIVTSSGDIAKSFQEQIDAAAVYWNASTRFTDGFEMGLGGELGISTQKLHVRGPVGLKELTSWRWVIDGFGQIRK